MCYPISIRVGLSDLEERFRPLYHLDSGHCCEPPAGQDDLKPKERRMPVILRRGDEQRWLDVGTDAGEVRALLRPYDEKEMTAHTVSRLVTTREADTNTPAAIEEFEYEGLPD